MKKIKYTCVANNNYGILLYLISSDDEDGSLTRFFVGSLVADEICGKIPWCKKIDVKEDFWDKITFRMRCIFKWHFRFYTKLYALDHFFLSPYLIGYLKYTLIEDSPGIYTTYKNANLWKMECHTNMLYYLFCRIFISPMFKKTLGRNSQCVDRLVTERNDLNSDLLIGKKITYVDLKEKWKTASDKKKDFVKDVFSVTNEEINTYTNCKVILFSQPLWTVGVSDAEQIEILRPYIDKYKDKGILIKMHPKDKIDYCKYFDGIKVSNSHAPMQLWNMMGAKFEIAITVFSSAVYGLPKDTEIVWIGTTVNEKLLAAVGDIKYNPSV